jgi:SAM-dependent MidA family methyltransferase
MTAAGLIRDEIVRRGPIPFQRFMELALYAPGAGYYTSARDPFGKGGDFFTAAQLQPVFGLLVSRIVRALLDKVGASTVVDLGAGRHEMSDAFTGLDYHPVEPADALPAGFSGVVFANEFFDALPVHLVRRRNGRWRELCVATDADRFVFSRRTRAVPDDVAAYLARYHGHPADRCQVEVNLRAADHIAAVSRAVVRGWFVIVDYGYTAAEWTRHAHGTLIGYHRHRAVHDVLARPGHCDITSHVAWTPLQDALVANGWRIESFCTLGHALLDAGRTDRFAGLFAGCGASEELRRRLQLKTLLFGMGETFRVLLASCRRAAAVVPKQKRPRKLGAE